MQMRQTDTHTHTHTHTLSSGVAADVLLGRREGRSIANRPACRVVCSLSRADKSNDLENLPPEGKLFALDKTRKGENGGE